MPDKRRYDRVWRHARLATLDPVRPGIGLMEDAAIASRGGRIAYLGPDADLPADAKTDIEVDCRGRLITPGLVDCHTHIVYGGNRAAEFEQRLAGASYREIAEAGGGIVSTVRATRAASQEALVSAALPRVERLMAEGVTTIEIKSGYGLDRETEGRMLAAARHLGRLRDISVRTTFLGAHALPPEAVGKDQYIDLFVRRDAAVPGRRRPARCGRCLLRDDRLLARAMRPGLRRRPPPRPAGKASCRSIEQRRRRPAGGRARSLVGRPSRIYGRGGRGRHGPLRHRGGAAARSLLRVAGTAGTPGRPFSAVMAPPWRWPRIATRAPLR